MIDKDGREEFRYRMIMYVDTSTMEVGVIVRVEVGFGREDAGDGDEGDDDDGVRNAGSSPLEIMLTIGNGTEGWTEDWDVYQAPKSVVPLETTQQQIIVEVSIKVNGREVRWQRGDGGMGTHTVAGKFLPTIE